MCDYLLVATDNPQLNLAMNSTTVQPFSTKPNVTIVSPVSAESLVSRLNLTTNINSGTVSVKKRQALLEAAVKLVGMRKGNESAESWAKRAQDAINAVFTGTALVVTSAVM